MAFSSAGRREGGVVILRKGSAEKVRFKLWVRSIYSLSVEIMDTPLLNRKKSAFVTDCRARSYENLKKILNYMCEMVRFLLIF